MDKCYRVIASIKGGIDKSCLGCSYWKTSMNSGLNYKCSCFEYWNCDAECNFKKGGTPSSARIKTCSTKNGNENENTNKSSLGNIEEICAALKVWLKK